MEGEQVQNVSKFFKDPSHQFWSKNYFSCRKNLCSAHEEQILSNYADLSKKTCWTNLQPLRFQDSNN